MGVALRGTHARRRRRRDRAGARVPRRARPDLVRRRLSRSAHVPARANAGALAEFAATGETSAFQYAPTRGLAGPLDALASRIESLQGRRPAEDELLITSGAIEALELVGKTFLERGDTVVVEAPTYLGAIMAFRSFETKIVAVPIDDDGPRRRRARPHASRQVCVRSSCTASRTTRTRRASRSPPSGARARRARAPIRLPDRRGRRVPRARLRRGRRAAEPVEPRARRRRAGRHDVEDVLPRPAARLGGRAGGDLAATSSRRSRTPISAPARSASGSSRSTSAAAGSRSSSRSRARSTNASARCCSPRSSATCPTARAGRTREAASSRGSRSRPASTRRRSPRAPRSRASGSSRARCSSRTAAATTACGSPSAWSTSRRSTKASSGSRRFY